MKHEEVPTVSTQPLQQQCKRYKRINLILNDRLSFSIRHRFHIDLLASARSSLNPSLLGKRQVLQYPPLDRHVS